MNYTTIRERIKTGDLLFWSHGSWASWNDIQVMIVRAFTLSEYSHVGVAWVIGGRVFVIHAIGRGVVIEPLSNQDSFYWCPMGTEFPEKAIDAGLSRVGESYSKLQAILAAVRKLKIGADRQWECAEFAIWFWRQAGIEIGAVATPAALARDLQRAGKGLEWIDL